MVGKWLQHETRKIACSDHPKRALFYLIFMASFAKNTWGTPLVSHIQFIFASIFNTLERGQELLLA